MRPSSAARPKSPSTTGTSLEQSIDTAEVELPGGIDSAGVGSTGMTTVLIYDDLVRVGARHELLVPPTGPESGSRVAEWESEGRQPLVARYLGNAELVLPQSSRDADWVLGCASNFEWRVESGAVDNAWAASAAVHVGGELWGVDAHGLALLDGLYGFDARTGGAAAARPASKARGERAVSVASPGYERQERTVQMTTRWYSTLSVLVYGLPRIAASEAGWMVAGIGRTFPVLCVRGDGIGPEVVDAAINAIDCAAPGKVLFKQLAFGAAEAARSGQWCCEANLEEFEGYARLFTGPVATPAEAEALESAENRADAAALPVKVRGRSFSNTGEMWRQSCGLFADVRPFRSLRGATMQRGANAAAMGGMREAELTAATLSALVPPPLDAVLIRDASQEWPAEGCAAPDTPVLQKCCDVCRVPRKCGSCGRGDDKVGEPVPEGTGRWLETRPRAEAARRIANFAVEYALRQGRRRVTVVCDLERSDADFSEACAGAFEGRAEELEAAGISTDVQDASALIFALLAGGGGCEFPLDVVLCPSVSGRMVASVLSGVLGSQCTSAVAAEGNGYAVFGPTHAIMAELRCKHVCPQPSAITLPAVAGEGTANPIGQMLAGAMLLRSLAEDDSEEIASRLERAVYGAVEQGMLPADLCGRDVERVMQAGACGSTAPRSGYCTTQEFSEAVCCVLSGQPADEARRERVLEHEEAARQAVEQARLDAIAAAEAKQAAEIDAAAKAAVNARMERERAALAAKSAWLAEVRAAQKSVEDLHRMLKRDPRNGKLQQSFEEALVKVSQLQHKKTRGAADVTEEEAAKTSERIRAALNDADDDAEDGLANLTIRAV